MAAKRAKARKAETKPVVAPYTPTPKEDRAIQALRQRRAARPPTPRIKVTYKEGEPAQIVPDHPDPVVGSELRRAALGTTSHDFSYGLLPTGRRGK